MLGGGSREVTSIPASLHWALLSIRQLVCTAAWCGRARQNQNDGRHCTARSGPALMSGSVPLIILTGFLGAGKTTCVNRILRAGGDLVQGLALLVNEVGKVDIDGALIEARGADTLSITGGCVCHAVDPRFLLRSIEEVRTRSGCRRMLLETTGIAEPYLIRDRLESVPRASAQVHVQSVVCVVDAEAALGQLQRHEEARAQVEAADRLVLTKCDRVAPAALAALHQELQRRNPSAPRAAFLLDGGADVEAMLARWVLESSAFAAEQCHPSRHLHTHGSQTGSDDQAHECHSHDLVAVEYESASGAFVGRALVDLCHRLGADLVRVKGTLHVAGSDRIGFLERAGLQTELRETDPWPADLPLTERRTQLVFIGRHLQPDLLRPQIEACRAAPVASTAVSAAVVASRVSE